MSPVMIRPLVVLAALSVLTTHPLSSQAPAAPSPLWGTLAPGPFAVGYEREWVRDYSRTWRITRRSDGRFVPDTTGRPVRIDRWYPARAGAPSSRMRLGGYARMDAPAAFADFGRRLAERDLKEPNSNVRPNEAAALDALPMAAFRAAPAAAGTFPLVLVIGGLNAEATSQVVLAEYLASHGYVVAVVTWTGVNEDQFNAIRTQPGIEATVRDVEVAWSVLRRRPHIDAARVATMGQSLGGLIALLAAMRNGNVSAAIGFDATYGFAAAASALTDFYGFAPRQMTAALLDVRRAPGVQGADLDLSAEHAFVYSDRTFVTMHSVRHYDFTSNSLISSVMHQPPIPAAVAPPGWTRDTAAARYQQAARMTLHFLDAKLKGDAGGLARLADEVARSAGAEMTHEAALPIPAPPLPPSEWVALATRTGFDAAKQVVEQRMRAAPGDTLIDASAFNEFGYALMSEKRAEEAVTAFRFVVTWYPTSANAFDSYGDGLTAAGRTAQACAAYAQALALAPSDATLSPAERTAMIKSETDRVGGGCPPAP